MYLKVIIVDDGSKDGTTAVGLDYVEKFGCDKVRSRCFFPCYENCNLFINFFINYLTCQYLNLPFLLGTSADPWQKPGQGRSS